MVAPINAAVVHVRRSGFYVPRARGDPSHSSDDAFVGFIGERGRAVHDARTAVRRLLSIFSRRHVVDWKTFNLAPLHVTIR